MSKFHFRSYLFAFETQDKFVAENSYIRTDMEAVPEKAIAWAKETLRDEMLRKSSKLMGASYSRLFTYISFTIYKFFNHCW